MKRRALAAWMTSPLAVVTGLMTLASIVLMLTLDRPIAELIHQYTRRGDQQFWRSVSRIGESWFYVAFFVFLYLGGRALFLWSAPQPAARVYAGIARAGLFGLASYALSGAIVHSLKYVLGRFRPKHLIGQGDYGFAVLAGDPSYNSFPSGHAQSAFTAACVLSVLFPKAAWAFLSLAVLVAASRVLGGAHFVSDVLFGSYVGIVSVLLIRRHWFADVGAIRGGVFRPSAGYGGVVHGK